MNAAALGEWGRKVSVLLWPSITLSQSGGGDDLAGIDGWDAGVPVQIKTDLGIKDRIFLELFKRDGTWATFGPRRTTIWRKSPAPHGHTVYIFVGPGVAIRATLDQMIRSLRECYHARSSLEFLRPNRAQEETAAGFFVPIEALRKVNADVRAHDYAPSPAADIVRFGESRGSP